MDETLLCQQDIAYKNLKIKEYMNHLITKNNNQRCECCPYGYHVNLDFVEFAKDISNSHNELQKIRRYQRKLERAQNNILNNNREIINDNIKESFTVKKVIAPEMTCSNAGNEIIYLPNSLDDCTSRSSEESVLQSPSFQNEINNSNSRNVFKGISLPEDNYKKISSSGASPKSFIVSYEHLMSIREQMSASLKRVQDLEQEVKNGHELRQRIDHFMHENRELQRQLDVANTAADLTQKFNHESSKWQNIDDIPMEVLKNVERIIQKKSSNHVAAGKKSRSVQTDVNGPLIVDTFSYLSFNTNDMQSQITDQTADHRVATSPKIHRRNFGVTVRPTHHHFTQQISFSSSKSFKPEEALSQFQSWITATNEITDQHIGTLLYNLLSLFFKGHYNDAISCLKQELITSNSKYKSLQSQPSQTMSESKSDNSTQVTTCEYYHHKNIQVQPIQWNKYSYTWNPSVTDSCSETERVVCQDFKVQTLTKNNIVDQQTQVNRRIPISHVLSQYEFRTPTANISSSTDQNLIDDLIAEQIEHTVSVIQEELKKESVHRKEKTAMTESLETNENKVVHVGRKIVNSASELYSTVNNAALEYRSEMINTQIGGHVLDRYSHNLVRSKINHLYFTDEGVAQNNNNINQSPADFPITAALSIDTDQRNGSTLNDESASEKTDSANSSPLEGCYYTTDSRIDYRGINQIDECDEPMEENAESVTETEQQLDSNVENVLAVNADVSKQVDELFNGQQFPQNIHDACNLVAIWMNDSTTTCSKDLNESLANIRQFWFELTKLNSANLQFYFDKFKSFNPTLLDRIINMTDANGNTCLHYAVSEGRWSIVRQILATGQSDVSKTNKAGYTVLMLAAVSDIMNEDTLRLLISLSEVDKQSTNDTKQTALMIAASRGKAQLVQILLETGASVNITDSDGSSALMCACDNGHLDVVRILLSRADIDTELEDKTGSNAMKVALDSSHKDIALLIFARNNLHKGSLRSKRRSGSNSHPTSPLSPRKFK